MPSEKSRDLTQEQITAAALKRETAITLAAKQSAAISANLATLKQALFPNGGIPDFKEPILPQSDPECLRQSRKLFVETLWPVPVAGEEFIVSLEDQENGGSPGWDVSRTREKLLDPSGRFAFIKVNTLHRGRTGSRGGATDADSNMAYTLLESDIASQRDQMELTRVMIAAGFPIKTVVYSGGKSFHWIVQVCALNNTDKALYKERVGMLRKGLEAFGFDGSTCNPGRKTRLPGHLREGFKHIKFEDLPRPVRQDLIYVNPAAPMWVPDRLTTLLEDLMPVMEEVPMPVRILPVMDREKYYTKKDGNSSAFTKQADAILGKGKDLDIVNYLGEIGGRCDVVENPGTVYGEVADRMKVFCDCVLNDHSGPLGEDQGRLDSYFYVRGTGARRAGGYKCSHNSCEGLDYLDALAAMKRDNPEEFEESLVDIPETPPEAIFEPVIPDVEDSCDVGVSNGDYLAAHVAVEASKRFPDAPGAASGVASPVAARAFDSANFDTWHDNFRFSPAKVAPVKHLLLLIPSQDECTQILHAIHGERMRFNADEKCWMICVDGLWRRDPTGVQAESLARDVLLLKMRSMPPEKEIKPAQLAKYKSCGDVEMKARFLRNMKGFPGTLVKADKFDANPNILAFPNGNYDFLQDKFIPRKGADMISRCCAVPYEDYTGREDEIAKLRTVEFLKEIQPLEENRDTLQEFLGYCLTGRTDEQKMLVMKGNGSNGKSTLLDQFYAAMGTYSKTSPAVLISAGKNDSPAGASPEIVQLAGLRVTSVSELAKKVDLSEEKLKRLTGTEPIPGRTLYSDWREITNTAKIIMDTNHAPILQSTDIGIRRRILLVEFRRTFTEEEKDMSLGSVLQRERSFLLWWAIQGARRWYRQGRVAVSQDIRRTTSIWFNEGDDVACFLDECLDADDPGALAPFSDTYAAYQRWTKTNGIRHVMSSRELKKDLEGRSFATALNRDRILCWKGLNLPSDGYFTD